MKARSVILLVGLTLVVGCSPTARDAEPGRSKQSQDDQALKPQATPKEPIVAEGRSPADQSAAEDRAWREAAEEVFLLGPTGKKPTLKELKEVVERLRELHRERPWLAKVAQKGWKEGADDLVKSRAFVEEMKAEAAAKEKATAEKKKADEAARAKDEADEAKKPKKVLTPKQIRTVLDAFGSRYELESNDIRRDKILNDFSEAMKALMPRDLAVSGWTGKVKRMRSMYDGVELEVSVDDYGFDLTNDQNLGYSPTLIPKDSEMYKLLGTVDVGDRIAFSGKFTVGRNPHYIAEKSWGREFKRPKFVIEFTDINKRPADGSSTILGKSRDRALMAKIMNEMRQVKTGLDADGIGVPADKAAWLTWLRDYKTLRGMVDSGEVIAFSDVRLGDAGTVLMYDTRINTDPDGAVLTADGTAHRMNKAKFDMLKKPAK